MNILIVLSVIALLILLNALFVAAEFSAIGARRSRIAALADEGNRFAKTLLPFLEDTAALDRYISVCQIGITLASLIVGFYGQAQLEPILNPLFVSLGGMQEAAASTVSIIVVLIFLTALQVIIAELLPKAVALREPERLALATVLPVRWCLYVLRPAIAFLNGTALWLMGLFGIHRSNVSHIHSPEELTMLFGESAEGGHLDAEEREMLENALSLETLLARQIMIPRTQMASAELSRKPAELLLELTQTPHTRFPVYENDIDHIKGMIHLKDLFLFAQKEPEGDLRTILRDMPIVPETNTVTELWLEMQQQHRHMAVLFDEYGGTVGLVTFEDIIEEVVGELQDEFDAELKRFEEKGEQIKVRANVLISQVNKKFLLHLSDKEADTLGGFVIAKLGHAPSVGDEVKVDGVTLKVDSVAGNAVKQVGITLPRKKGVLDTPAESGHQ